MKRQLDIAKKPDQPVDAKPANPPKVMEPETKEETPAPTSLNATKEPTLVSSESASVNSKLVPVLIGIAVLLVIVIAYFVFTALHS